MAAFNTAFTPSTSRSAWGFGLPVAVAIDDAFRNGDNRA